MGWVDIKSQMIHKRKRMGAYRRVIVCFQKSLRNRDAN